MSNKNLYDCARMYGILPPNVLNAISMYCCGNQTLVYKVLFQYSKKKLLNIYGIAEKGANSILVARMKF